MGSKMNKIVNEVKLDIDFKEEITPYVSLFSKLDENLVVKIDNLLSKNECNIILEQINKKEWVSADYHGKVSNDPNVGSWRMSTFNDNLASIIWKRLLNHGWSDKLINNIFPVEHKLYESYWEELKLSYWKSTGVSNLFRFIKYKDNGFLVPHYDKEYKYDENKKTLMSLVIYLTDNDDGATRRIKETRVNDFSDMDKPSKDIVWSNYPKTGSALCFDHYVLHDSEPVKGEKIIIRTDIVFERIRNV
jgi:hypothetical protein